MDILWFDLSGDVLRKEYKAPYMPHALVFRNIVSFNLFDFCQKIYKRYKHDEEVKLTQEFIFAKMITLMNTKSHLHNAQKAAVDLMMFSNAPYVPWYFTEDYLIDQAPDFFTKRAFESVGKIGRYTGYEVRKVYIDLLCTVLVNPKTGEIDKFAMAKALLTVVNGHEVYKHCCEQGFVKKDVVLLGLYEFIHRELLEKDSPISLASLTNVIYSQVSEKSQSLLMFKQYYAHDFEASKRYSREFLKAQNVADYNYHTSFYANTLEQAIKHADWEWFDQFFALYAQELGSDHKDVKDKLGRATVKRLESEHAPKIELQINPQIVKVDAKKAHAFAPYDVDLIDIDGVDTKDLFYLVALLEACEDGWELELNEQRIKYIFPAMKTTLRMLSRIITKKLIRIDMDYFDQIAEEDVNLWESYLNAPFSVNVKGLSGPASVMILTLKEELMRRGEIAEVQLHIWRCLARSYFFSSFYYYLDNVDDAWVERYSIPPEFEQRVLASKISGKKMSYVAYSAIKSAVGEHGMGKTHGYRHTRNILSFNLKKYMDYAENSAQDYSKPRHEKAPVFGMEKVMADLTGISYEDLYNCAPNLNALVGRAGADSE